MSVRSRNARAFLVLVLLAGASIEGRAESSEEGRLARRAPRQIVVMLAPGPGSPAGSRDRPVLPARLEQALREAKLEVLGRMADRVPPATASAEAVPVFDLDPAAVLLVEVGASRSPAEALSMLRASPDVAWAEPNRLRQAAIGWPSDSGFPDSGFPRDPCFRDGRQWGLHNTGGSGGVAGADIAALDAWRSSCGATDLRLAVVDTGIDPQHPDLQMPLPDGAPRVEAGHDVAGGGGMLDSLGHGTMVAGVMAAITSNGALDTLGVAGVCGGDGRDNAGCRIVPIRVTRSTSRLATSYDLAAGILLAVRSGARAVNVSFAGGGPSRLERLALYHALTRGCVVVAASGNRGSREGDAPQYPAAYAADGLCIQVGASDRSDRRAAFSSYGPGLDVVAPGVDIWSTWPTHTVPGGTSYPGYVAGSGTSFAAPFVTGTVGLLVAVRPELADRDFQEILRRSADDVGAPGRDAETGWGRLDAGKALTRVGPGVGVWHDEVAAAVFRPTAGGTLWIGEDGLGSMRRALSGSRATLYEARATVSLPDSFADSARVWIRVGGTTSLRPGFELPYFAPWAEVERRDARTFSLRGFLYRLEDTGEWLPLPPDQIRFGFTVLGDVSHRALARAHPPVIAAHPSPFRRTTSILTPAPGRVTVFDAAGRRVRRLRGRPGQRRFHWDGRDDTGILVAPGLYLLRLEGAAGPATGRVVRID